MCSTSHSISSRGGTAKKNTRTAIATTRSTPRSRLGAERITRTRPPRGLSAAAVTSEADSRHVDDAINEARLAVWAQQPKEFLDEAILDPDGTIVLETETPRASKAWDIGLQRQVGATMCTWSSRPIRVNPCSCSIAAAIARRRSGRRVPEQGRRACVRAGFRKILLRGDTRIGREQDLDPWDGQVLPRDGQPPSPRPRTGFLGRCPEPSASSSDIRPMDVSRQGRRAAGPSV